MPAIPSKSLMRHNNVFTHNIMLVRKDLEFYMHCRSAPFWSGGAILLIAKINVHQEVDTYDLCGIMKHLLMLPAV